VIRMCVVYEALGETLRMNFVVAFLELWLRMISLELWLGILGKHVTFLELWLGITPLELWLGMADEHEHSLSYGLDWRVLSVWVCELWLVQMGLRRFPSSALAGEFGSLGTIMNYGSYWELHLTLRSVVRNRFSTCVLQVVACR